MEKKKNQKYFKHDKLSTFKLSLSYITTLLGVFGADKDLEKNEPFLKLLTNYADIAEILELGEENLIKYLFLNKKKINTILYDEDENINLDKKYKNLYSYFYLCLLINDIDVINYLYSLDFIKEFYEMIKKKSEIIQIFLSLFMLILTKYYKETENFVETEEEELEKIDNYCKNIITPLKIDVKEIEHIKLEEIYIKKIIDLLKSPEDLNYNKDILEQLDIKNINITHKMFNELSKYLSSKEFTENYNINEIDDLKNTNKIKCYYILLIYVLKNPLYIYQHKFLLKTKKNIIGIIKTKPKDVYNLLYNDKNIVINNILNDIITFFADSDYYIEKYIKSIINSQNQFTINTTNQVNTNNNTNINNTSYNNFDNNSNHNLNQSHIGSYIYRGQNDSFSISNNTHDNKNTIFVSKDLINKILNNSSFTFEANENGKKKFVLKDGKISFDDLNKIKISDGDENLEKRYKKFLTIFDDFKNSYNKNITINYNLKLNFDFKYENEKENLYIKFNGENNNKSYSIKNIFRNDTITKSKEFTEIITDISDYITTKSFSKKSQNNSISNPNDLSVSINNSSELNNLQGSSINESKEVRKIKTISEKNEIIDKESDEQYKVIDLVKIIGRHEGESEYILEDDKGFLISADSNNNVFIYDSKYSLKEPQIRNLILDKVKNTPRKWALSIYQKSHTSDKIEFIACSKIGLKSFKKEINSENIQTFENNNMTCSVYFNIKGENDYITGGEKGIFHYKDGKEINNLQNAYRGGIRINEKLIAFTSNSILPNGKDELIFYNIEEDKEEKNILKQTNYSFTISTNSLALMTSKENKYNILLCGCKKYCSNQKNGIFLINLNPSQYSGKFFDLEDFEVFCFCPLSILNEDKKSMEKTNYFLVGGFEIEKRQGAIKLYKIKNLAQEITIEFIQDVEFDEKEIEKYSSSEKKFKKYHFYGFERTISCIIQSKFNGNIFITSWDGYDYLCKPPNIKYYLEYDERKKKTPN